MDVRIALGVALVVVCLLGTSFATRPSAGGVEPVAFDETLSLGMTGVEVRQAETRGYAVPRGQAFYAQYRYVVGYYGVEAMASQVGSGHARRQFGRPMATFVTEYGGAQLSLAPDGGLLVDHDPGVDWVPAEDAWYVVESEARTPGGPVAVPFERRRAADRFASDHGGRVVDWITLSERTLAGGDDLRERFRSSTAAKRSWANETVSDAESLGTRPISTVVGEDAPTVAAAVRRAPPDTTVVVPPGRHDVNLTVAKPITLRGAGEATVLHGNGDGTVLRATTPGVGLLDLRVAGVGDRNLGNGTGNVSGWDAAIRLVYGRGDAGVLLDRANGSLVRNVTVDTRAHGILARASDSSVIENVTVRGTEDWRDGSMGVLAMHSRLVVQRSSFHGGRDGVYTHYAPGIVIRDNEMTGMRYGVHEMYTSGALVRNNTVTETDAGVIVMTRPRSNLIVGNEVRRSEIGVSVAGDASFVVDNVVVDDHWGLTTGATRSMYAGNTVVDNDVGIRADTIVPSNRVVGNDVVGNDRPAVAPSGPLAVWTHRGRGNFWAGAPGLDRDGDGTLERIYRPTDRLDVRVARADVGPALARSPAMTVLRRAEAATPGLRRSGAVDVAPLAGPARPERLRSVLGPRRWRSLERSPNDTTSSTEVST